ncbi:ComF family protein [Ancylothrix sp. C2]|uniref:ComF family protein n=1 Tax=Ancylothrix sp. D3o TaxID=2953691 RepID=UPI0021BA7B2E|nr:ComF family protein [Ancylothrix sp. D3o]MCT7952105.1 ComF family protein [Ancylothrix sp. D3o]
MANTTRFVGIFKSFLNLFLKSPCCLCGRPAQTSLCLYCHRQLQQSQFPQVCHKEHLLPASTMPVFVWGVYGGILKRAIAVMKYENQPQLAKPLGEWVGEAWLKQRLAAERNLTVVPIPLHSTKLKARGFNQAELLAEHFCSVTNLPLQRRGLVRIRETEAQFGLSAVQRQENLRNAFSVGTGFRKGHFSGSVLLFDDIYTTGSTIRAAVEALGAAGVPVWGVVAVAAPPPRIKQV